MPGGPKSWAQLNGKPAGLEGGEYDQQKGSWIHASLRHELGWTPFLSALPV